MASCFEVIGEVASSLPAVARGSLFVRGDELIPGELEREGDVTGPAAVAALLRAAAPDHPLLPLCSITRVPVPPPDTRPLVRGLAPTMVDPWIGPVNLAWLTLVERATREVRLGQFDAPPAIMRAVSCGTQSAFLETLRLSEKPKPLVPPLVRTPAGINERDMLAIAFVRRDALVVQRAHGVYVISDEGRVLHAAPPSSCKLAGVLDDRIAVFSGFLDHRVSPMLTEEPEI